MTDEPPLNIGLQHDVTAALERSDEVESTLGVSAHEGVVTIAGSVANDREVTAAQDVAEAVPGVHEVAVEIQLRRERDQVS